MRMRETTEHPSAGVLLLHLAHELPERQERELAGHLAGCWACIALAERLKQGIQVFVEARELSNQSMAVPLPRTRALRARLDSMQPRAASDRLRHWWQRLCAFLLPFRSAGIAAGVAVPVLALLFLVTRPPDLSASELLRRASLSVQAGTAGPHRKLYRRIRIRSGSESVDWQSEAGANPARPISRNGKLDWTAVLQGPAHWDDPLSVHDFQRWRDAQQPVHDEITESSDLIILTTAGHNAEGILRSSLTVRRRDWHPVAKTIYIEGQEPLEITEIAWELREQPESGPSTRSMDRTIIPGLAQNEAVPPRDCELAEIEARSALFSLGVGVTGEEAGFTAQSTENGVRIDLATSSADRKIKLQQALDRIPGVEARITGPGDPPASKVASLPPAIPGSRLEHATAPLLWERLVQKLGSNEAAAQYSVRILEAAVRTRAIAVQMHALSARYPDASPAALTSPAELELASLKQDMLLSLEQADAEYNRALAPVFEARDGMPSSEAAPAWQHRADALFGLVSARDRLMAKLFASTVSDQPSAPTLAEAVQQFNAFNAQITVLAQR